MGLPHVPKNYLAKKIPQLPSLSTIARGVWAEVSSEVAGEGVGTRFPHPCDVLMWFGGFTHRSMPLHHLALRKSSPRILLDTN